MKGWIILAGFALWSGGCAIHDPVGADYYSGDEHIQGGAPPGSTEIRLAAHPDPNEESLYRLSWRQALDPVGDGEETRPAPDYFLYLYETSGRGTDYSLANQVWSCDEGSYLISDDLCFAILEDKCENVLEDLYLDLRITCEDAGFYLLMTAHDGYRESAPSNEVLWPEEVEAWEDVWTTTPGGEELTAEETQAKKGVGSSL